MQRLFCCNSPFASVQLIFMLVFIVLITESLRHRGLISITPKPKCFDLNYETVMGEQHRRAYVSRNFRGWLCHSISPVLNHSLEGKAECTPSFYTLALNWSRKIHPVKCKHYFLVSTTLNPSDLQTTDCTSLFIDDWPNHKLLCEKHHASFYMVISPPSSSFTAVSAWYGCVHIVPSSWSWWHSASFGRKLMTFALLQAMFFTYGLFGRIVRTWSDGGVQPKLLLSFCSALLSPSMMIQFLCSGWKSTAK